jgi:hypothetical protein
MRTYRARRRERDARLVDPEDAPTALADNRQLLERVDQLTDERDRLWAQIVRLQQRIRELERTDACKPSPLTSDAVHGLSRPERRRLEREQLRRRRRPA